MKKVLFATSALVAASFATVATAQDVTLSTGGALTTGIGFGGFNAGNANVDQDTHLIFDGEIVFTAAGALDNGLEIEIVVELEMASDQADQIDEQFINVISQIGTFSIGGNDSANDRIMGGTGAVGGVLDGAYDPTYDFSVATTDANNNYGDRLGVYYFTPVIFGLRAGISYQQTNAEVLGTVDSSYDANDAHAVAAGVRYNNSFGDVDFEIGLGGLYVDGGSTDAQRWSWEVGGEIGYAGFLVGLRYENSADPAGGAETEYNLITGGVEYATGPWAFGIAAAYVEQDNVGAADREDLNIAGGFVYELGNGVEAGAQVLYGQVDGNAIPANSGDQSIGGVMLLSVDF